MPSLTSILTRRFKEAIQSAFGVDADPLVGPAQNEKFGDYQANAAMSLAKVVAERTGEKANPRQVAERIKGALNVEDLASEVSIAGPGFINVKFKPEFLANLLRQAGADPQLGVERTPTPQTVVVDYSGPNIAKELHVGHLRSTIIGDAMVRVLGFQGHRVIKQNHVGDWGTQFGMLIAFLKESGDDASHIEDLEDFYRRAKKRFDEDATFADVARQTVVKLQGGDPDILAPWRKIVDETRNHYQPLYNQLGVRLAREDERGESFYNPMLPKVVAELKSKDIAVESKGATVVFPDGVGEDKAPLIIEKSGGGYLYGTTDLAAAYFRIFELHAKRIIYFTDSRQSQHFAQVFKTAKLASWTSANGGVSLEHAPFGTILGPDNKPFKTRSGDTVKLKDLLDEAEERAQRIVSEKSPELPADRKRAIAHAVGIGAIKYADLSKDRTSDYVFDWDRMLSFEGNTAPYLQNAYVRVHGIFRKAKGAGIDTNVPLSAIRLESQFEIALAKHILRLGDVIELVGRELKPHHLCNYLYELATRYHGFFENCPVLQSDGGTRQSRLALCGVVAKTLATGLDLLGIEHPEQM
jgi:arginyl-tRNA synthetase